MAQRAEALALYRDLLRAARRMPTLNRRAFVVRRVRDDFRAAKCEGDSEKVSFLLAFGAVSLENVRSQAATLAKGALFAPWSR